MENNKSHNKSHDISNEEDQKDEYNSESSDMMGLDSEALKNELEKFKEGLLNNEFITLFNEKLRENIPMIKDTIQKEVVDQVPDINMITNIRGMISDIAELHSKIQFVHDDLYDQFKIIGSDVKEVYMQLEAAFAKTSRERADMVMHMKEVETQMSTMSVKVNKIISKTAKIDEFMDDVVSQFEIQLMLDHQDEVDRHQVALYGLTD